MSPVKPLACLAALSVFVICAATALARQARPVEPRAALLAVGDIVYRGAPEAADATGRLMERLLDEIPNSRAITLGDNCNDDGSEDCYDRFDQSSWGRLRSALFPVPGNHDYEESVRTGSVPHYYLYFPNAGPAELGYYAFDWGGWRVIALNSELMRQSSADPRTAQRRDAQLMWLEQELRRHARTGCVMAYFHRPPFSSGDFASPAWVLPIFRKLYQYGVDLYVAGHEHFFAYLPPLSPDGTFDRSHGIPGLIAGTGGAALFPDPRSQKDRANPPLLRSLKWAREGETLVANRFGIVRIDLRPGAFDWTFVPSGGLPIPNATGSGVCHENPSTYQGG
jgi:alkaline phosphatase